MANSSIAPTKGQSEWLKENFKKYKNAQIAIHFNVPEWKVSFWLKYLGIRKINRGIKIERKRQKKFEKPKPPGHIPGIYSNISREQHIDRILSMNI